MNKINQIKLAVALSAPVFVMAKSAVDMVKLTRAHKQLNDDYLVQLREDQDKIAQMIINNDLRRKGHLIEPD